MDPVFLWIFAYDLLVGETFPIAIVQFAQPGVQSSWCVVGIDGCYSLSCLHRATEIAAESLLENHC